VAEIGFPLRLPSAEPARAAAAAILGQIDDYALPRLANLDAPTLVVVGGPTGAGKSTLVNSLVRAPVSAAGVLRPTTRAPVLVCHPADTAWFRSDRLLSRLPRTADHRAGERMLQLIAAPALAPGLALLDAPDIDSVVAANRELADQLFAAADLWLFVTTAERYADAVPWQLLHTARERGAAVALVLARVPPGATTELVDLLSGLLVAHGLASLPLFVLPETRIDRQGLLPEPVTEPLRGWLDGLAADERIRAGVVRCTLDGALAALPPRLAGLAAALDEQLAVAEALAEQVGLAYGLARGTVERGVRRSAPGPDRTPDVSRLPAEEWARAVKVVLGAWRDRTAELAGRRPSGPRHRPDPAESGLVTLVGSAATEAAEQTDHAWRGQLAGSALLAGEIAGPSPELARRVRQAAREQPFDGLLERVGGVLDAEAGRWLERLAGAPLDGSPARRLREVATRLERARVAAKLAVDQVPGSGPVPAARPDPDRAVAVEEGAE
jgi:energy-coupling factor transporter ATP-binding protein EcfA2